MKYLCREKIGCFVLEQSCFVCECVVGDVSVCIVCE